MDYIIYLLSKYQLLTATWLEVSLKRRMAKYPELVFKISGFFCFLLFLFLLSHGAEPAPKAELTSTCIECHEGMDTLLAKTPHRILVSPEGEQVKNSPLSCGDCHSNWERHLEEPALGNIGNPEKISTFENFKLCTSCHFDPHSQELSEFNVHFRSKISCSDCHSVHQPEAEHLLVKSSNDLCLECHQEIGAKFSSVSHHPVREKVIKCVDCHQVLGEPGKTFSFVSPNRECYSCHSEFEGPHPFEHEAVNDYYIEEEGCIFCHDAHGSPNPRLLKQPLGQLCLQCHFLPKHQTAHGGIWAKRNCMECHVDVHGSYTSKHLFTDDLFGGACFGRGCHSQ